MQDDQSQTDSSAMFTIWNLIADINESNDRNLDYQQQQITDFYARTSAILPRIACLMQLYFNATSILDEIRDTVVFAEGDVTELTINEGFLNSAKSIILNKFYVYDKTYVPLNAINRNNIAPMIIVGKPAVLAAWKWYEHHLNIVTTLFTINYSFNAKPTNTTMPLSIAGQQKTLKQAIMLINFNIFPLATLTDKHPITGQT